MAMETVKLLFVAAVLHWLLSLDTVRPFAAAVALYWLLSRRPSSPTDDSRPSSQLLLESLSDRPSITDRLLRKRIIAKHWKIVANRARALYYTKRASSSSCRRVSFQQQEDEEALLSIIPPHKNLPY